MSLNDPAKDSQRRLNQTEFRFHMHLRDSHFPRTYICALYTKVLNNLWTMNRTIQNAGPESYYVHQFLDGCRYNGKNGSAD